MLTKDKVHRMLAFVVSNFKASHTRENKRRKWLFPYSLHKAYIGIVITVTDTHCSSHTFLLVYQMARARFKNGQAGHCPLPRASTYFGNFTFPFYIDSLYLKNILYLSQL